MKLNLFLRELKIIYLSLNEYLYVKQHNTGFDSLLCIFFFCRMICKYVNLTLLELIVTISISGMV